MVRDRGPFRGKGEAKTKGKTPNVRNKGAGGMEKKLKNILNPFCYPISETGVLGKDRK